MDAKEIARMFDVPPWLIAADQRPPRFRRIRWALRRWWRL